LEKTLWENEKAKKFFGKQNQAKKELKGV